MTILEQTSAALDAIIEAEEMAGLISLPHDCQEWKAWDKVRSLLTEAARACAEQGAIAATRCVEHYRELGYKECGVCRKWKPEDELTEEAAGYESKKGESSRSQWYRCNQCKSE
jgi:hypothetical protein